MLVSNHILSAKDIRSKFNLHKMINLDFSYLSKNVDSWWYKSKIKNINNHYLKLDLVNYQCDNDKLIKDSEFYKKKIELLDNIVKLNDEKLNKQEKYMKYLKTFIIIVLLLNAYFEYVKYMLLILSLICFYL